MGGGLKGRLEGSGGIDLGRNSYEVYSRVIGTPPGVRQQGVFWDFMVDAMALHRIAHASFEAGMPDNTEAGTHPATPRPHLRLYIKLEYIPSSRCRLMTPRAYCEYN